MDKSSKNGKGSVFGAFIVGVVLIIAAFPCIWMNERRAVHFYKLINEAEKVCIDVVANKAESELDKCLVRIQGEIESSDTIKDSLIPDVYKQDCLKLVRNVQTYVEEKRESTDDDGNT